MSRDDPVYGLGLADDDRQLYFPSRESAVIETARVKPKSRISAKKKKKKPKDPVKMWKAMGKTSNKIMREWSDSPRTSRTNRVASSYRSRGSNPGKHVMGSHRGFVHAGKQTSQAYWEI